MLLAVIEAHHQLAAARPAFGRPPAIGIDVGQLVISKAPDAESERRSVRADGHVGEAIDGSRERIACLEDPQPEVAAQAEIDRNGLTRVESVDGRRVLKRGEEASEDIVRRPGKRAIGAGLVLSKNAGAPAIDAAVRLQGTGGIDEGLDPGVRTSLILRLPVIVEAPAIDAAVWLQGARVLPVGAYLDVGAGVVVSLAEEVIATAIDVPVDQDRSGVQ